MDIRVQQALDGELPRSQLSNEEAAVLAEAETLIDGVVRAVPNPVLPDLGPAVLRRLDAQIPSLDIAYTPSAAIRPKSLLGWLLSAQPVLVQWRPAYGLGMAAALALLLMFGSLRPPTHSPARPLAVATQPQQVLVQFRLDAPQAQKVALAGDFKDWKPAYALRRSEPGVWTVVVPLHPGVHDYAFIVDGQRWVADPMAPAIADGFGGLNSRLAVIAPDQGRGI
jgi:hypothetical protein